MPDRIALIGFGEAGSVFAAAGGWRQQASAYDVKHARRAIMEEAGVVACSDPASALAEARLVLSLVTAAQALEAAERCAPLLPEGAIWCDMNSVAPQTKKEAASIVESHGAHYVDVAVLAPVNPARLQVPLLLSGKAADEACDALRAHGFGKIRVVGGEVGRASAIKMVRSIMVKGIEALTCEMMAAAERADVTEEILASLDASWREEGWERRAAYNLERMATHGVRRAEEMEEVAKTLVGFGIEPVMTRGTIELQRSAAATNTAPSATAKDAA